MEPGYVGYIFQWCFFIRVYFEREAITEEENLTFVQPRSAK